MSVGTGVRDANCYWGTTRVSTAPSPGIRGRDRCPCLGGFTCRRGTYILHATNTHMARSGTESGSASRTRMPEDGRASSRGPLADCNGGAFLCGRRWRSDGSGGLRRGRIEQPVSGWVAPHQQWKVCSASALTVARLGQPIASGRQSRSSARSHAEWLRVDKPLPPHC